MSERAPSYLVVRLKVIESHVRQLASDLGLDEDSSADLSVLGRSAELAGGDPSKDMVEAAIKDLRALAQRIAAEPRAVQAPSDGGGGLEREHHTGASVLEESQGP